MAGILQALPLDTPAARTAATVLVLVALVVYRRAVEWTAPLLRRRLDDLAVEAIQAVVIVAGVAGTLWLVVAIWGATGRVEAALAAIDADTSLLVVTAVVAAATYAVARTVRRTVDRLADRSDAIDDHRRAVTRRLGQLSVSLFGVLLVLSLWRVDLGNLLLGAGVVGIVVGLAARQTLGAALAGLVVLFTRPFEVGDWVEIDGVEGVVDDITLLDTRVRTFDDEYVVVPNDAITATEVVNRSRMGRLRVEVEVGVAYATDLEAAREAATDAMTGIDDVATSPEPRVVVEGFGDSAVRLRCRYWIEDPSARRYWQTRTAVVAAVRERLADRGVEIPFPQRELSGAVDVTGPEGEE